MTSSADDVVQSVDKDIAVQFLLKQSPSCNGWVRRKGALNQFGEKIDGKFKLTRAFSLSPRLQWTHRYAILHSGKIYVYKDETATKAHKVLILGDFERIERVTDDNLNDVPWPFRLVPLEDSATAKNEFFSVTSEDELQKWETALRREIFEHRRTTNTATNRHKAKPGCQQKTQNNTPSVAEDEAEYTRPDESDDDSVDSYVDVDVQKEPRQEIPTNSGRRPLPIPGQPSEQPSTSKPPGRRSLPPTPLSPPAQASETKHNPCSSGSRPVPVPPTPDVHSESTPAQPRGVTNKPPVATKRPSPGLMTPPPIGLKPNMAPKPKPAPPPPHTSPSALPRQSSDQSKPNPSANCGGQDDLVYELEQSIVDKAMWSGTPEGAQQFLRGKEFREGSFMIRQATDASGFSLLVICNGAPCKFKIEENPRTKTLTIASQKFENLESLITHFQETNLPNKQTPLTLPYTEIVS